MLMLKSYQKSHSPRLVLAGALIWLGLIASLLLMTPAARADSISTYNVAVGMDAFGVASFSESIDYVFAGQQHGIYRDVPTTGKLPDGKYIHYDFSLITALRDSKVEPRSQSTVGSYERIKIGDPKQTITGAHSYDLRYTLAPFVRHDPKGDYISVNVIGTEWDASIARAEATLTLPTSVPITSAECFTGGFGSRASECTAIVTGNIVTVRSTSPLGAREGMTLDVLTPANSFDPTAYVIPTTKGPNGDGIPVAVMIFALMGLAFGIGMIGLVVKLFMYHASRRRQQQAQTIVPQYEAPDGLLPGEVGLLTDDKTSMVEITATILHLAQRGHLKIGYESKKQLFGSKQTYRFTKVSTSDKTQAFERTLLNAIFSSGDSVEMSQLVPTTMSTAVTSVKSSLLKSLQKKGYYAAQQHLLSAENVTAKGYVEWAKVEGLKLYLNVAEKDRINFHDAPAKTPEVFSSLLPYAIALQVEEQWAKQFAGMDVSQAMTWYEGDSRRMDAVLFTRAFSGSFASAVSTHFSPPSSSGGSGGGFSGGGGGGGGGGSW